MAKVLGESGRYVSNAAVTSFRRMQVVAIVTTALLGVVAGFILCLSIPHGRVSPIISFGLPTALLAADFVIWKISGRKLDAFEKARTNMRRGLTGEAIVAAILEDLSDDYCVINDLTTNFGNVDHVVIGPTGVFLIDAKNWRGIVASDGKGELLLNGRPTDKPTIRPFVVRLMTIKDKVRVLAPETNPYFRGLFVFASAIVDADWGSTGSVHCLREDKLIGYIIDQKIPKKLSPEEVERIAQAFLGLAKMDGDFDSSSRIELRSAGS